MEDLCAYCDLDASSLRSGTTRVGESYDVHVYVFANDVSRSATLERGYLQLVGKLEDARAVAHLKNLSQRKQQLSRTGYPVANILIFDFVFHPNGLDHPHVDFMLGCQLTYAQNI